MERCGRRQDEHSASEWQLLLFQSIIHYRAKCCGGVPPLFDLSYYCLCKLLILPSLDGVSSRHALALLLHSLLRRPRARWDWENASNQKIFKINTIEQFKGIHLFPVALFIFYTFLIKYFQNIHQQLKVSFLVWTSTDQWEIRVKQSDSSSPALQRLIRASCFLVPWGCSGAGESLEARKQYISTSSSIMALSWGAHLLCCSAGAQQDDCHNESTRWKLSGTKQHSQWH